MLRLRNALRQHRHVFIIVPLLALATTFPTIVYVFNTDVFWHPAGTSHDVYLKFWDIWYGKLVATGQADLFATDLIFYPEGLSLAFHTFSLPHIALVNALGFLMPISNAFSLTYILYIVLGAFSAYAYLVWLLRDQWIALFGAVVFGFSPHVVGHANHVEIAFVAPIPLAVYCLHRGIIENRPILTTACGLLTGLTTIISLYNYVCLLIILAALVSVLAITQWRDKRFWLNIVLLILAVALSSLWRVFPFVTNSDSLGETTMWHGEEEIRSDAIAYFVNPKNPLFSRLAESNALNVSSNHMSGTSYLGYLPLLLIGVGLYTAATRRKMAPWVILCAFFLVVRLGSRLVVNDAVYADILLPKHYLNQMLPTVFYSFWEADHFMIGALLPFAVLVCFGLRALQNRFRSAAKPAFVLALIFVVALEYHVPVQTDRIFPVGDGKISRERLAFLDWLEGEAGEIRLINLPMGRANSKLYNLYQSLSGYPHAEGAIARTPDSAFDYIRANLLLNAWRQNQPIRCDNVAPEAFLAALARLEQDGFSHIVHHRGFYHWRNVTDSFKKVNPAYEDEFVAIYRLPDLQAGCPQPAGDA